MSVLFLVLDALPARHVGTRLTPALAGLAAEGGWARAGGVAVMPTCTYPNHATFVTGTGPARHGIHANHVVRAGRVLPAAAVGPRGPTVFDACAAAGRRALAVLGDHNLVGVMGAGRAAGHWPPGGSVLPGTPLDGLGYATDEALSEPLLAAAAERPDLLVAHLNGPDTAAHLHGPDSAEAAARYRATDAVLGQLLEGLRPHWDEWAVIVVSDHDQETVTIDEPVDVAAAARAAGVGVEVVPEGGAALVAGPDPDGGRWLDGVDGVEGHRAVGEDLRLVWTTAGRFVGSASAVLRGVHGSPRQAAQAVVVGGGHPAVGALAAAVGRTRPAAASWAGRITDLLGLPRLAVQPGPG